MRCGCGDCGTSLANASLTDESRLLDCLGDRNVTDLKDGLRKARELAVQLKKDAERITRLFATCRGRCRQDHDLIPAVRNCV